MEHTSQSEQSKQQTTVFKSEFLLSDDEIRQRGITEHQIELYRRMQYQASFGIDTWLHLLVEHTFETEFVELTYQEGLQLAHYLDTVPDEQILQHVAERIDEVIRTKFPNGAFVKLNTRSPKDVPVYDFESDAVKAKIAEEFDSLGDKLGNDTEEVWAFIRATIKMTRVNSGLEALDLLRRSTRIREDLGKILRFGEKHFSARVTVREWLGEVAERPQFEFRGFAHNKELNAVTQYFSTTYGSEVHQRRDEIAAKIKSFHDSIRDKIPHSSYVIDFYVTRNNRLLVVELNPFHIGAGAGLFTWREHRDLFMNGPYTFRVVEEVPADTVELVPVRWAKWIDQKYHPHKWIQPPVPESDEEEESSRWCIVL